MALCNKTRYSDKTVTCFEIFHTEIDFKKCNSNLRTSASVIANSNSAPVTCITRSFQSPSIVHNLKKRNRTNSMDISNSNKSSYYDDTSQSINGEASVDSFNMSKKIKPNPRFLRSTLIKPHQL